MGLGEIIDCRRKYERALKEVRNLAKVIAEHIATVLPDGVSFEWSQGTALYNGKDAPERFEMHTPIIFHDDEEPTIGGYYLDLGVKGYKNSLIGLSKKDLTSIIALWKELPGDVLDKAFGDAIVRISSNGKFTVEEN